jgi:hypothetical protein
MKYEMHAWSGIEIRKFYKELIYVSCRSGELLIMPLYSQEFHEF